MTHVPALPTIGERKESSFADRVRQAYNRLMINRAKCKLMKRSSSRFVDPKVPGRHTVMQDFFSIRERVTLGRRDKIWDSEH
jgi:hypothetical protein